jgi:hypothetical protein
MPEPETIEEYRAAYDAWQKQLTGLHDFLLEGKRPAGPLQIKGLLNREARAKRKYDLARFKLLGIEEDDASIDDGEDDEES